MKAIELIKNEQQFFLEGKTQNKKMLNAAKLFNSLIAETNKQIQNLKAFLDNEENGELNNRIIVTKSLAEFFGDNKTLRLDIVVQNLKNQEQATLNAFYNTKNKLLATLKDIIKASAKEAIVANFDLYEGEYTRCENDHEIIILGGRNVNVLESLASELDTILAIKGLYDSIPAQSVDFSAEVHNRNIYLCTNKNKEVYSTKPNKMAKMEQIINQLDAIGQKVVAFYTYKEALADIGCNPKNIKAYENELSKLYIPLKKALQKEFKIELEDICNVVVNENEYEEIDTNQDFVAETYTQSALSSQSYSEEPTNYTSEYNQQDTNTTHQSFENNAFSTENNYQESTFSNDTPLATFTDNYQEPNNFVQENTYTSPTEQHFEPSDYSSTSFTNELTAASAVQQEVQNDYQNNTSVFTPSDNTQTPYNESANSLDAITQLMNNPNNGSVNNIEQDQSNYSSDQPYQSPFAQSSFASPINLAEAPTEQPNTNPFASENQTVNPNLNNQTQDNPFLNNSNNPFLNNNNPFDQQ